MGLGTPKTAETWSRDDLFRVESTCLMGILGTGKSKLIGINHAATIEAFAVPYAACKRWIQFRVGLYQPEQFAG